MNLGRQAISATTPTQIIDVRFDADAHIFTCTTPEGFAVYKSNPLTLLRRRQITGGTLSIVLPLHSTSLLFLVGGGAAPRYSPNKVILWDDALGQEVAELEFNGLVKGLACRRGNLVVALKKRVVLFEINQSVKRVQQEWETSVNDFGIVAIATTPGSTLLAIPGKQTGQLQLIHLPPCAAPEIVIDPGNPQQPYRPQRPPHTGIRIRHPVPLIFAHKSALTAISIPPSGRVVATTSDKGTLLRIWEVQTGDQLHEFRRGIDQATIYGISFRPDELECCVWSDKGTAHVFSLDGSSNRTSLFKPVSNLLSMQGYTNSEWSYAQYHLPTPPAHIVPSTSQTSRLGTAHPDAGDKEKFIVAWIQVQPTHSPLTPRQSPTPLPTSPKGKGKATEYRKPEHNKFVKPEYQLVAVTFTGGWYRLSLPHNGPPRSGTPEPYQGKSQSARGGTRTSKGPSSVAGSVTSSVTSARKQSEPARRRSSDAKEGGNTECILEEFRRFGRWDGWG